MFQCAATMLVLSGLLKLRHACKSPGACYIAASDAVGWGWGLRLCICNKLSGAAHAAGPLDRSGIARLHSIMRSNFSFLSQNYGHRGPCSKPFASHFSNVGNKECFFYPFAHTSIYQNIHSGALLIWVVESSADPWSCGNSRVSWFCFLLVYVIVFFFLTSWPSTL